MKTILIAKPTRDAMIKAKEELIAKMQGKGIKIRWSDYAVETEDTLYTFKTIMIPLSLLDPLRGYSKVHADEVIESIEKLLESAMSITGKKKEEDNKTKVDDNQKNEEK